MLIFFPFLSPFCFTLSCHDVRDVPPEVLVNTFGLPRDVPPLAVSYLGIIQSRVTKAQGLSLLVINPSFANYCGISMELIQFTAKC